MKINSDDKLKLFKTEAELVDYLKVNGITGGAQVFKKEHVEVLGKRVKVKPKSKPKSPPTIDRLKKTRMVVTETDESVELK